MKKEKILQILRNNSKKIIIATGITFAIAGVGVILLNTNNSAKNEIGEKTEITKMEQSESIDKENEENEEKEGEDFETIEEIFEIAKEEALNEGKTQEEAVKIAEEAKIKAITTRESTKDISAQRVETPAPKIETPTPKAEAPVPKVETPTPKTETPAPKVETPAPKVQVGIDTALTNKLHNLVIVNTADYKGIKRSEFIELARQVSLGKIDTANAIGKISNTSWEENGTNIDRYFSSEVQKVTPFNVKCTKFNVPGNTSAEDISLNYSFNFGDFSEVFAYRNSDNSVTITSLGCQFVVSPK